MVVLPAHTIQPKLNSCIAVTASLIARQPFEKLKLLRRVFTRRAGKVYHTLPFLITAITFDEDLN